MSTTIVEVDGLMARVTNENDGFVRGVVEVVAGRQTPDGFLVDRVEPTSVEHPEGSGSPRILWQRATRLLPYDHDLEPGVDGIVVRVPRGSARAVALALLAYVDGDGGGPPGDASALRKDLQRADARLERSEDRRDRLEDVLIDVVERMTPVVSGSHVLAGLPPASLDASGGVRLGEPPAGLG